MKSIDYKLQYATTILEISLDGRKVPGKMQLFMELYMVISTQIRRLCTDIELASWVRQHKHALPD